MKLIGDINPLYQSTPDPANTNPPRGILLLTVSTFKTPLANTKVTADTDVKITWAHHENQLVRFKLNEVFRIMESDCSSKLDLFGLEANCSRGGVLVRLGDRLK